METGKPSNQARRVTEADLLLPFERQAFRGEYKEFLKIKRGNCFATIQSFPGLWRSFQLLDDIWLRDFADLENPSDVKHMLPIILFMNAHARYRTAFELALSCCIPDAWNVLWSGIESTAHAHKILREPHLAVVWLDKDEGPAENRAYKKAFEESKRESLFSTRQGLGVLHKFWSDYSETATHSTVASLGLRFQSEETPTHIRWQLNYFEADQANLAVFLFSLLLCSLHMEDVLYRSFESRLKLDVRLAKMRRAFGQFVERNRQALIKNYGKELLKKL